MKNTLIFLVGALFISMVVGCHPTKGDTIDRDKVSEIDYRVLKGEQIPDKVTAWLENNEEFEQALLINDEGKFYVVVTRGRKNTGGYGVDIKGMTLTMVNGRSELNVDVKYQAPDPDKMVTQALTYPYIVTLVDLKQEPEEVKFNINK